jgi:type IV secretory pathway TrbD component
MNPRARRAIVTGVLAALLILVLVGWALGLAG